jgi:hypothetical protein
LWWQDHQIILEILDELGVSLVCEPWIPEDGFEGLTLTRQDLVQQSRLHVCDFERLCCVRNTEGVGPEDVAEMINTVYTGGTDDIDFLRLANYLNVSTQVSYIQQDPSCVATSLFLVVVLSRRQLVAFADGQAPCWR